MKHASWLFVWVMALTTVGCSKGDAAGPPDSGPPAVDQCVNGSDLGLVNALVAVPDGGVPDAGRTDGLVANGVVDLMTAALGACVRDSCGPYILSESAELGTCVEGCVAASDLAGLSTGCTGCWTEFSRCAATNCVTLCVADFTAPACVDCLSTNCLGRYFACTGYEGP